MFGSPLMEHDERYELAPWNGSHIIKQLWTREEPFDFRGPLLQDQEGLP